MKTNKSPVTKITLTRVEGPNPLPSPAIITEGLVSNTKDNYKWGLSGSIWDLAHLTFQRWGHTAPFPSQGYDKCDFEVEWQDGTTYKGRYDLQATGRDDAGDTLSQHITQHLKYHALHTNNHGSDARKEAQNMLDNLELI